MKPYLAGLWGKIFHFKKDRILSFSEKKYEIVFITQCIAEDAVKQIARRFDLSRIFKGMSYQGCMLRF